MRSFIIILCFLLGLTVLAQSSGRSYVSGVNYLAATSQGQSDSIVTTVYYDGLGRRIQTVTSASGTSEDIVDFTRYDSRGRVSEQWLVCTGKGSNRYTPEEDMTSRLSALYGDQGGSYFSSSEYAPEVTSLLTETKGSGAAWQNATGITHDYGINSSSGDLSCLHFSIDSDNRLVKVGTLQEGDALTELITDEDGKRTVLFYGRNDSILLERRIGETGYADTYHVYDRIGNRRYVIPPMAADIFAGRAAGVIEDTDEVIRNYCYIYRYDSRNRLIEKKLPGAEPIYFFYDKQGLLRYTQDGMMRVCGEYMVILYDIFNRVAVTGLLPMTTTSSELRTQVREEALEYTEFNPSMSEIFGYSYIRPESLIESDVVSVNYYDDYRFLDIFPQHKSHLAYREVSGYDKSHYDMLAPGTMKAYQTGSMVRILDTDSLIVRAIYYDSRGRQVQSHSTNHLGGYDHKYYKLSFTGKPLEVRHEHTTATASHVDIYRYTYDAMERLQTVTMQHDGGAEAVLESNTYDAIGRLTTQTLNDGATPIAYTYNVRGWLKTITSPNFSQALYYETDADGNAGCLNGNISANIKSFNYRNSLTGAFQSGKNSYLYSYDGLNRLSSADHSGIYSSRSNKTAIGTTEIPDYSTEYSYDLNGNISHIKRKGRKNSTLSSSSTYVTVDSLFISYSGNQQKKISDTDTDNAEIDFTDLADEDVEYTWDKNGNMTSDLNAGITSIEYNHLNLPRRVEFADGHITEYLYDASGRKLRTKYLVDNRSVFSASVAGEIENDELMVTAASTMIETELVRDYVGNYVYEDSVLERTIIPNGYITSVGAYRYYILDHQGNIVTTIPMNMRSPWSDYYPFGSPMTRMTFGERYKYSGKEFDTKNGIYLYDFHARQYSPILNRFTTLDPLCEIDYAISPYVFCRNNPVRFSDRTGCVVETLWDVANISLGVNSFVDNVSAGNVTAAIADGVGIAVDIAATILPGIPGGAGTAIKAARAADNAVDATNIADDVVDVATTAKYVHGNSKLSTRSQHAYDVINTETNEVVKTGVSGGRIRIDGKSSRAESQVRKWNKIEGNGKYKSVITHTEPASEGTRDRILQYEIERADYLRKQNQLRDRNKHKYP